MEPLSWWTGMKTPLQLLINGENISDYDVTIEGGKGVKVTQIHIHYFDACDACTEVIPIRI